MVSKTLFKAYPCKICVCWAYSSTLYRTVIGPPINV